MLRGRLWRHPDFLKLWAGETVSEFGSQVTLLAVPTVAILVLHAGPFQVGVLSALEFLAFPTLGLVAGVYADRLRRRPIMIVCDIGRLLALAFLASAVALASITTPEPESRPSTASGATGFIPEMREGIDVVFKSPILWRIAGCTATTNLGSNMIFGAVFLVFAYRDLHLTAAVVGVIFGISSVGWLVGAFLAAWLARTFGLGMTLGLSILLGGLVTLATPLALIGVPAVILSVLGFLNNLFVPVYNINQVSLRQSITPDRVQGRMNATMRTIVWGTIPVGAFTGGILGTTIGVVQTIILGSVVSALAALWIFLGPVARLKEQPVPAPA